jgi:putative membrane protein
MTANLKKLLYGIIFITVLIVGITFFMKNNHSVSFNYFLGMLDIKLSLLLLMTLILGTMMGILSLVPVIIHLKYKIAKLNRQVKIREKEVNNLRVIPVKDPL